MEWLVGTAITVALLAGVASVFALRACYGLLAETHDALRVLQVTVFGLDAKLGPNLRAAMESADAALVGVEALRKSVDEVVMSPKKTMGSHPIDLDGSPFGRAMSARRLFASLEEESLAGLSKRG